MCDRLTRYASVLILPPYPRLSPLFFISLTLHQVLANTQAHPTITTAWLLERAGLSDRRDITAQMAYMGFTDKHAVLLAQQAEEQRKFAIASIFPPERFGEQYTFAMAMFDQALVAAREEIRRGT